jgi:hypothetical protein
MTDALIPSKQRFNTLQLGLPLKVGEGAGVEVWNMLMKADLSRLMQFCGSNLHWALQENHLNSGRL